MSDRTPHRQILPGLRDMMRPIVIWTLHFILVYAALSAACSEREVTAYATSVVIVAVGTGIALILAGWGLLRTGDQPLRTAARLVTIISLLAILFNAAPVLLLEGCR